MSGSTAIRIRQQQQLQRTLTTTAPSSSSYTTTALLLDARGAEAAAAAALGGTEDIGVGVIMAVALALFISFLQGRSYNNNNNHEDTAMLLRDNKSPPLDSPEKGQGGVIFDAEKWKDMSRPENYVLYKTRLREKASGKANSSKDGWNRSEKRYVIVALLALFIPIFSLEFFLALSRQIICGSCGTPSEWAQQLCAPHYYYDGP